MQISLLKIYSHAIVAANKALDSDEIEAVPTEHAQFADGELSDNVDQYTAKGVDADGKSYEHSLDTTLSVKAKWLPIGTSNRKTPPDVRRGEIVVLYQFADQDKYYWTTLFYDMRLRKLETVIYAFSNTRDESADGTADNTYYFEVSTHQKLITLHTSKSDGEPFAYTIQLNTKTGAFAVTDDIGNYYSLDSTNERIEFKNSQGSWIDMNKQNVIITAPDSITFKAGKNIIMNAGTAINSTAGQSITMNTTTIVTQANTTTNTVPNTSFSGNVSIGKTMTSNGLNVNAGGGGGFNVSGSGQFSGQLNVQQLTSSEPISAPNVH